MTLTVINHWGVGPELQDVNLVLGSHPHRHFGDQVHCLQLRSKSLRSSKERLAKSRLHPGYWPVTGLQNVKGDL